ncbi:MAG: hypothetical protein LBO04_02940 [Spirochaetaceae bacterium]|jgi:predicted solute-binding protein|nr:hypothetical protein [Spirochaetaceae bacterium]
MIKCLTENESRLVLTFLKQLRNCFDRDGKLVEEYYQNVFLFNLDKEEKEAFDHLLKKGVW